MTTIISHDCSSCALHKAMLNIKADEDDIKVYNRIQTQINNTQQAAQPTALVGLPPEVTEEDKRIYMSAALENYEKAKALLSEWWQEMIKKYNVPMSAKFDSDSGEFYECRDDQDRPDMTGQYIAK